MHNSMPYGNDHHIHNFDASHGSSQQLRNVYVNQQFHSASQPLNGPQTILVNPHFKLNSKVFVNPNFSRCAPLRPSIHVNPRLGISQANLRPTVSHNTMIHVNPNANNVQMTVFSKTVHVNPKFGNIDTNAPATMLTKKNSVVVLTRTKLIRNSPSSKLKRRNSIKSKYKIIKTGLSPKKNTVGSRAIGSIMGKSRFKIDNRKKSFTIIGKHQKRYIWLNKLVSTSELLKTRIIKNSTPKASKHNTIIDINGVVYRKSRNSLRRASVSNTKAVTNTSIVPKCSNQTRSKIIKKFKIIRKESPKKICVKKLRKCNIPCPSFKKYGVCKGRDNGRCFWKHDPDQIALCTRFLQGACVKENCLLSHNVSPEKMPTCKYYLEGSCVRENCPYLHIKISPKAEVCRDFLEGFCRKASECDKRHQYLCPEYEKYGKCVKQRCSYPHGKMVRTYLINNKFAKKCFKLEIENKKKGQNLLLKSLETDKKRYYVEEDKSTENNEKILENTKADVRSFVGLQSRPKLGSLPLFIPFKDS